MPPPPQSSIPDLHISTAIISDLVRQIDSVNKQNDHLFSFLFSSLATIRSSLPSSSPADIQTLNDDIHSSHSASPPPPILHNLLPEPVSVKHCGVQTRHSSDPRFVSLQKDNSTLQATLKEYESTLELIMSKFRSFALSKQEESKSNSDSNTLLLELEKQKSQQLELDKTVLLNQLDLAHAAIRKSIDQVATDFVDLNRDLAQFKTEADCLRECMSHPTAQLNTAPRPNNPFLSQGTAQSDVPVTAPPMAEPTSSALSSVDHLPAVELPGPVTASMDDLG